MGGCAMQGLVTPLELVAYAYYLRRRRAAKPTRASRESVAVVGSGTRLIVMLEIIGEYVPVPDPMFAVKIAQQSSTEFPVL